VTATATRPATRRHQLVGLTAAFGIGLLVAVQSRINGELGHVLGDGVAAATISFGSGLVILLIGTVLVPPVRAGLRQVWETIRSRSGLRWWQCLGGLSGAYLVTTQSITVSVIGVAVFTVAGVAGQAVSSLVVDRLGFGPAGPQPFTALRVVGALIAVVAVVLAVSGQLTHSDGLLLAILPALAGVGTAIQQAVNGRVARTAGQNTYGAVSAGVVNFLVGFAALVVVLLVDLAFGTAPHHLPTEPWLYFGGACGVIFISAAAAVVRVVGVFVLGLATIAGQLIASLFIDLFVPAADKPVTLTVVAGTLLALVAVIIAAVPNLRVPKNG
jgi:transporter family-2 protein